MLSAPNWFLSNSTSDTFVVYGVRRSGKTYTIQQCDGIEKIDQPYIASNGLVLADHYYRFGSKTIVETHRRHTELATIQDDTLVLVKCTL